MLTVRRSVSGQVSGAPRDVAGQSMAAMSLPISPPAAKSRPAIWLFFFAVRLKSSSENSAFWLPFQYEHDPIRLLKHECHFLHNPRGEGRHANRGNVETFMPRPRPCPL